MNIPPEVGLCPHNDEGFLTGTSGGKQFGSQENSKLIALFLTSGNQVPDAKNIRGGLVFEKTLAYGVEFFEI